MTSSAPTLRPHQARARSLGYSAIRAGRRAPLFVAPTGAGKTRLAASMAADAVSRGRRVVWLAHRRELVQQARDTLALYDVAEKVTCASYQGVCARGNAPEADVVVLDECVIGSTMIGSKRAEEISVGDLVPAMLANGTVDELRVTHVFVNRASSLRTIRVDDRSLTCTDNHPIWIEGEGYVEAAKVSVGDLCRVRSADATEAEGSEDMQRAMREQASLANHGSDEPSSRVTENEGAQSDADRKDSKEDVQKPSGDRPSPSRSGRERKGDDANSGDASRIARVGVDAGIHLPDATETRFRVSRSLQDRHREQVRTDRNRDRWREPSVTERANARRQENELPRVARVDHIEVHEQGDRGGFGEVCPDGLVYNFEVEREHNFFANGILTHNCHHLASKEDAEWKRVVDAYQHATRIGLTATPERYDGQALAGFDALIEVAKYSELIAAGYLVPCRLIQPPSKLESRQLLARPVDAYLQHAPSSIAVVYGLTVEECELFAADFRAANIAAEVVHGAMVAKERAAILARWRAGVTLVVVNCGILTEGFDYPAISTIILARGCGSVGLYIQMGGRGARPFCRCGKSHCECAGRKREYLLIDLSGASWDLGSPTEDRVYSLEGRGIQRAGVEMPDIQLCAKCGEAKPCSCPIFDVDNLHTIVGDARELAPHLARIREEDDEPARVRRLAKWIVRDERGSWKRFRAVYGGWPSERERATAYHLAQTIEKGSWIE